MTKETVEVLVGTEAITFWESLGDDFCGNDKPNTAGYFSEEPRGEGITTFVAFDNINGECFAEEFKTEKAAEDWCREKFSIFDKNWQKNYPGEET